MRILSYLNLSNGSDLERDSGFLFQRTILEELAIDHDVTLIGPPGTTQLLSNVRSLEVEWPESKYGVRFGWNWQAVQSKLRGAEIPDVVLNNQSELTVPMRLMLWETFHHDVPIVTYFHYLAVVEHNGRPVFDDSLNDLVFASVVWSRQLEALRHSSASIVGSNFGRELLSAGAEVKATPKPMVIPPPITPGLRPLDHDGRTILYNHRLYDHYGTESTFRALKNVCDATASRVLATDPTQNRSRERSALDSAPSNLRKRLGSAPWLSFVNAGPWDEYATVVGQASIGMAPDRQGALWSMAAMDLMSIGRPVLVPARSGLGHALNEPSLTYSTSEELEEKMIHLLRDDAAYAEAGRVVSRFAEAHTSSKIAEEFLAVFEQAILPSAKPAGAPK